MLKKHVCNLPHLIVVKSYRTFLKCGLIIQKLLSEKKLFWNKNNLQTKFCCFLLKGEFHGSAHARILTGLCTLSGTGPGFSLFMNQSWASYLILHANSSKIINRRINLSGQQLNSTVHCVGKICWNPLRILFIRLLPQLTIASEYWTTSQCGFWSDNID